MADAKQTLEIIIAATDHASNVFSSVGDGVSGLANSARDVTQPLADLTKGVLAVDAALLALTGGGLALAVSKAGEFGGQFAEITTLIEETGGDIGEFRQQVLDYANGSTASIEAINGAIYSAISAGGDYRDSLSLVSQAEQLAIAGKADLNDSTVLLASSLNAYGESASMATRYSDALFSAVKDGQTTIPELASSLAQVTGIAANSGVSFEELLASIAALTASGMPTSTAISSIKMALSSILQPSVDAAETAERLGLQFDTSALATKGLSGFLAELQEKAGGNIDAMSSLFGSVEGLNGALVLTGNGAEKFNSTLTDMQNSAGATTTAYGKMAGELDQINQQLANNVDTVLIGVGDKIKDSYSGLVGSLTTIVQSLGSAVEEGAFDGLLDGLKKELDDAKIYIEEIAAALPTALAEVDFGGIEAQVGGIGDAINGLFGGLDLSKPEDLRQAVQRVVDTVEGLIDFSGGVVRALEPLFDAILVGVEWFTSLDAETQRLVGTLAGAALAVNLVSGPLSALGTAAKGTGDILSVLSKVGFGGLKPAVDALLPSLASLLTKLSGPAGVGAVVTATAVSVGLAVDAYIGWQEAEDEAAAAADRAAKSAAALVEKYVAISEKTGVVITSTEEFKAAIAEGTIVFDEATQSWVAAGEATQEVAAAFDAQTTALLATAASAEKVGQTTAAMRGDMEALGLVLNPVSGAFETVADSSEETGYQLTRTASGAYDLTAALHAMGDDNGPAAKTARELDGAAKKSKELELKLMELVSNERIKSLEIESKIAVAQIEADADQAIAAFDSVSDSVASLSDLVGKSINVFAGLGSSISDMQRADFIADIIQEQVGQQGDLVDAQVRLSEAQRDYMRARTEMIRDGKGEITIDLDGVEPAIELVIFQILDKARVKMAEDFDLFLAGVG